MLCEQEGRQKMIAEEINGSNLKQLRELCGLSQYGLAQLVDIPRTRISLVECGYAKLRGEEQETIHNALLKLSATKADRLRVLSRELVAV
jgi:transcriptional regulator with XRE-family HTH domain